MEAVVAPPPGSARSSAPIDSGTQECPAVLSLVANPALPAAAQPPAATASSPTLGSCIPSTPTSVTAASISPIPSPFYETATGERVRFFTSGARWHAIASSSSCVLPVVSQESVGPYLRWLQGQDRWTVQARLHLMPTPTSPAQLCVYVGKAGLSEGGPDLEEDDRKPAAKSHTPPPKRLQTVHTGAHTRDLVQLYNDPGTSPSTRAGCADVLRNRIAWFNEEKGSLGTLNASQEKLVEYADMAKIQLAIAGIDDVEKEARKRLLGHYFIDLYNAISEAYRAGEAPLLETLAYSISHIDVAYFQQDMTLLTQLVKKLLDKLTDDVQFYTQDTYRSHVPLLYAVRQSLLRVHEISSDRFNPSQPPYSRFKEKLEKIIDRGAAYYPIRYYVRLILQSLVPLESSPSSRKLTSAQRADLTWCILYMGQFLLKTLGERTMDVDALKNSLAHYRAAYPSGATQVAPWYATHQAMRVAALLSTKAASTEAEDHFKTFQQSLAQYEKDHSLENKPSKRFNRKAHKEAHRDFYYGLRDLYQLLGLFGGSPSVRRASIDALSYFGSVWGRKGGNTPIQAGYLESLAVIAVQSKVEEERAYAHGKLQRIHFANDSSGLETLLASVQSPVDDPPAGDSWFSEVPTKPETAVAATSDAHKTSLQAYSAGDSWFLEVATNPEAAITATFDAHKASLQAHYRDKNFSHIRPLFADEDDLPSIAVDQLSHTLAVITCDDKGNETQRTPITLANLFAATPHNAQGPVQRVLLLGDPGMGKTTLSQQLAYQWIQGKLWSNLFTYVYVLPVRTLSGTLELQGLHKIWDRVPLTLPNAIIQRYYEDLLTEDTSYKTLYAQITGHLTSSETLVVLDGLDERSENNKAQNKLIKAAPGGNHKLLLLSRPYNVAEARDKCDLEVTHVGLSEAQMFDYIDTLSPLDHSARKSLKEDLLTPPSHSAIKELACVPINLQILCYLWQIDLAKQAILTEVDKGVLSIPRLYQIMVHHLWERYYQKSKLRGNETYAALAQAAGFPVEDKEKLFTELGRIGYVTHRKEKQLFKAEDVTSSLMTLVSTTRDLKVMRNAGFLLLKLLPGSNLYQFPHLTFQEYFAGRWLSKQLSSDNKREKEKAEAFIKDPAHRYAPRYGQMFTFMAGEAMKDEDNRYENLRNLLVLSKTEAPRLDARKGDMRHLAFQLRILNEWAIVSDEKAVELGLTELSKTHEFDVRAKVGYCVKEVINKNTELNRFFPVLRATLSSFRGIGFYVMPRCMHGLLKGAIKDSTRGGEAEILSALASIASTIPFESLSALKRLYADDASSSAMRRCIVQALGEVPVVAPTLKERVTAFLDEEEKSKFADEEVRRAITKARQTIAKPLTGNFLVTPLKTADLAFGAEAWAAYFGDVGEVPDLPLGIEEILDSPCPFFSNEDGGALLVRETHLLTLIPATVNCEPLTLNLLERLIQSPKNGGHATKYWIYYSEVKHEFGDTPSVGAYWALVTRDILPGSRYKDYAFQQALLAKYEGYALPGALEVATSILCHHVRSGRLLSAKPSTYSRCKEVVAIRGTDYPVVVVGGFEASGLGVDYRHYDRSNSGVAGCWKF